MSALDRFATIDTWVFDLDNTLYPAHCDLFAQVDRRIGAFISALLGLDPAAARVLQKQYYRDYGTSLRGLMSEHGVDPRAYMDYVHDIDLSPIAPDEALAVSIAALPGRKYIFTNGSRAHAENVAGRIGILHLFDDVFDVEAGGYVPKPHKASYDAFLARFTLAGERAAMFEDLARNLEVPAHCGMTTVLVTARDGYHPDAGEGWVRPVEMGPHVHHVTDDLAGFLARIPPLAAVPPTAGG